MSEANGAPGPQTPAEFAREAEFLSIKCDELRHACLGFLDDGVTSPDVSVDDVTFVQSVPPERTLERRAPRHVRVDPPDHLPRPEPLRQALGANDRQAIVSDEVFGCVHARHATFRRTARHRPRG